MTEPAREVSSAPWLVTHVTVLPGYRLFVRFIDGTEGEVDMSAQVNSPNAGVFAELADPEAFSKAFNDDGHVAWPTGQDLAPDAMHDALAANGRWVLGPFSPNGPGALDWQPTRCNDEDLNTSHVNTGLLDSEESMPEISRFFGIVILMHFNEHAPPHFHARYGSSKCSVDLQTLRVTAGHFPRRAMAMTLEWAAEYRKELMEDWELCANGQIPRKIPPLE
jgi:hypothetical protein